MSEITIKRAVLHVLDVNSTMPVLSNGELELHDELKEYLNKQLSKIIEDSNAKKAQFIGSTESNEFMFMCSMLADNEQEFLPITADIARRMFELMQKNVDIPAADLICCLFEDCGSQYLCLLKLNYKTGYTHWVDAGEEGSTNTIIRYQTLLPQEGQKLEECALINLSDMSIRVIEKQYEINGEKDFYISNLLLKCTCDLSNNAKMKIIDKVAKSINKKYFDEDFEKAIKLKKAVSESFDENSEIHIEQVASKVFEKDLGIQNEYVEEISKAGLSEKKVVIPEKIVEKKFRTHKIKTDTGIEINFPLEYADERDKIEFMNNPDGTISIIIKNINKIENK
jgi:hypothetical protein